MDNGHLMTVVECAAFIPALVTVVAPVVCALVCGIYRRTAVVEVRTVGVSGVYAVSPA